MLHPKPLTLTAQSKRYKLENDPIWYLESALGATFWSKQAQIIASVRDNNKTTVCSCHASGKTWTASRIVHWFLHSHPNSIVITTAPTWRQVEEVLWSEIRDAYENSLVQLPGRMTNVRYDLGPKWYATGLSTDDPDKFNGFHAEYILIIIDEASGVAAPMFDAIEGVASTGYVRILELGNPTDPGGHFADTFKSQFYNKIEISCFDTPNFKSFRAFKADGSFDEKGSIELLYASDERARKDAEKNTYLISPTWVYQRLIEWGDDSPMFQSRCLGHFPEEGENTLISLKDALKARWKVYPDGRFECQNHIDGVEETLGVDVARFGNDKTVLAYRKGNKVETLVRKRKQDLMQTVKDVVHFKVAHPHCKIHVDDTGVGGGVTDRLREIGVDGVAAFNVGSKARNSEQFANQRAELYWNLKTRFRDGDIAIPYDDALINDLTRMRVDWKLNGQILIESKQNLRKRGIDSPDSADAIMLAFAPSAIGAFDHQDGLISENVPEAQQTVTTGLLKKEF